MENKKTIFHVKYDGVALANNEMNVKDLAPALLAIGELLEEANDLLNERKTKISINTDSQVALTLFDSYVRHLHDKERNDLKSVRGRPADCCLEFSKDSELICYNDKVKRAVACSVE